MELGKVGCGRSWIEVLFMSVVITMVVGVVVVVVVVVVLVVVVVAVTLLRYHQSKIMVFPPNLSTIESSSPTSSR